MTSNLNSIVVDPSWSFADCTQRHTRYITHAYHTYPAKFIPQLATRLILELSEQGDTIVDPFMGSGTTIIEAMVHSRKGIGTDINPVAHLIAKVKSTPIAPKILEAHFAELASQLHSANSLQPKLFGKQPAVASPQNDRIDYWFSNEQKKQLDAILGAIMEISNQAVREFFMVGFSQILKTCSIWLQKSVKPVRDLHKKPADPLKAFERQVKAMLKRNQEFHDMLPKNVVANIERFRKVYSADARCIPINAGTAKLVVTSPPYVTSYEYADLHQLTGLWFSYFDALPQFRQKFIGSTYTAREPINLQSEIGETIVSNLKNKKAREVEKYFADMLECFTEMNRVLKKGGFACVVIGNTAFQGVEILNAEVYVEQMQALGFKTHNIVRREIPSKMLPQVRDPKNGKFTSATAKGNVLVYPTEYILIMEKQNDV